MDQLKHILAVAKKYHFWILCGLILCTYLGMWFVAVSKMSDETQARVSEINSAYDEGQSIRGIVNHPNEPSIEMMKRLNRMEAEQVRRAWERRYREQEDVLVWPAELKPDFIAAVERLIPIETQVEYPTEQEPLKLDFRNRYRDYIREEMPLLADIIGAEWKVGTAASGAGGRDDYGGGMGMGGGYGGEGPGYESGYGEDYGEYGGEYGGGRRAGGRVQEADPIIVEWSQQNQSQLLATSFNWGGRRPTTLQVLYTQEDLWVLRALLMVIKATNGDADARYNAAVKEITTINLGRSARGIKAVGRVKAGRGARGGGGSMYGDDGMGMGDYGEGYGMEGGGYGMEGGGYGMEGGGYGMEGGGYGMEGEGDGMEGEGYGDMEAGGGPGTGRSLDPADYRYVDDEMDPLTGEKLRSAVEAPSASNAFLVVAKRMPVRLRVNMDIRKLPLLLCECANSDLPVEVRQVRINAAPGAASGMGGGMGGMGGYGMGGGGGYGGQTSYGMGGGEGYGADDYGYDSGGGYAGMEGGMGGGMAGQSVESPYDADVELYGLIYVYNPVDPDKLGMEEAADEASGAAASSGETNGASATEPPAGGSPDGAKPPTDPSTPADTQASTSPAEGGTTEENEE